MIRRTRLWLIAASLPLWSVGCSNSPDEGLSVGNALEIGAILLIIVGTIVGFAWLVEHHHNQKGT